MARENQTSLSEEDKSRLLEKLEIRGKSEWDNRWENHMAFPSSLDVRSSEEEVREKVLRYLLFRILINQQAKYEKVREVSVKVAERFGDALFYSPFQISEYELIELLRQIAGPRGGLLYRVGFLGGIKPLSLFAYRFKSYEGFIRRLGSLGRKLTDIIAEKLAQGSHELFDFLCTDPILDAGWVGNDPKACRMYVNWVVFLFSEVWGFGVRDMSDTMMIVDGHVGKVFCRSGLLNSVLYEGQRPHIISASQMRSDIEAVVSASERVPFYVDNGAFYLFEDGYCTDLEPRCNSCPISEICMKYKKWTAYKKWS
jgi:hypothetical protein